MQHQIQHHGQTLTVNLDDGVTARVRPIRSNDLLPLLDMHVRLSAESLYARYLRSYEPTVEELAWICNIDPDEGAAFVVALETPYEPIIAVAYYVIDGDGSAEPAIVVEDRFQGQGVGTVLWQHMSRHALSRGITTFNALIHLGNESMLQLIRRSGQSYSAQIAFGAFELHIALDAASDRSAGMYPSDEGVEHAPIGVFAN